MIETLLDKVSGIHLRGDQIKGPVFDSYQNKRKKVVILPLKVTVYFNYSPTNTTVRAKEKRETAQDFVVQAVREELPKQGYDVIDYFNIDPHYGTMEDFDQMVKALHEADIKIIMDLVINHNSSEHPFFQDALKNKQSKGKPYHMFSSA